jgi:hypothetical protein
VQHAGEIDQGVVPLRKAGERVRGTNVGFHHGHRGQKSQRLRAFHAAGRHRYFGAGGSEGGDEVPPYETAAAYDEDPGEGAWDYGYDSAI